MGEMQSLDPVFSYDGVTQGMMINVYDTLLKFKGSSMTEFLPSVSEEVPSVENGLISKDGRTYTFPIRKGIKFHDGTELTAEDVRYSLLRFMLSDISGGPSSLLLEPILGITSTRDEKGHITADFKEAEKAGAAMVTCGIFPLYRACLKIYGAGIAALSALMYVLCSSLFRLGYFGLREAGGVLNV